MELLGEDPNSKYDVVSNIIMINGRYIEKYMEWNALELIWENIQEFAVTQKS